MAMDDNLEERILIVTTASGRPVWRRAMKEWSPYQRLTQVVAKGTDKINGTCVIVGWGGITEPKIRSQLLGRKWDRVVFDESHYAKNIETKRTQSAYGDFTLGGQLVNDSTALIRAAGYKAWCLTGTPIPNAPNDLYPMLRAMAAHKLHATSDVPDVTKYQDFLHRYCVVRMKKISNFRKIPVVVGGRNLEELKGRIGDFMLRRTQQDVGIRAPIYETLPLAVSPAMRREVEDKLDAKLVLAAAEAGDTKALEMELGPLRRLTGEIKAHAVVAAVKEEFECGLDKIVLAYWHKDVGQVLKDGLSTFGVVGIDGSTPANKRDEAEQRFLSDPSIRVFLAQIKAAGEAIDLSSSANLWFVETSFTPSDMSQMSKRVTNLKATRQAFVRVAVLEGSIDEALQEILLRKWTAIREVLA
jgi:SNF2 family DNA or RNA helicase